MATSAHTTIADGVPVVELVDCTPPIDPAPTPSPAPTTAREIDPTTRAAEATVEQTGADPPPEG